MLYFSIKGRLTHIQLLRQHFYIKVLIRQISFYDVNNPFHKIICRFFCLALFRFLLLQHQSFGINTLQAFALQDKTLYPRFQYFRIKRFQYIIVRPHFRSIQDIRIFCLGSQHQNRNMRSARPLPNLTTTDKSILNGHHDVRYNKIRNLLRSYPDTFFSIDSLIQRIILAKQTAYIGTHLLVVFNNKKAFLVSILFFLLGNRGTYRYRNIRLLIHRCFHQFILIFRKMSISLRNSQYKRTSFLQTTLQRDRAMMQIHGILYNTQPDTDFSREHRNLVTRDERVKNPFLQLFGYSFTCIRNSQFAKCLSIYLYPLHA